MANTHTLSGDDFQYWAIDFVRNEFTVVMSDGQRHTGKLPPGNRPGNQIAQSVFDWERWWVISTTKRGDTLISEAYSPVATDRMRPSVYLDQNHWSTLAWAKVDPHRVKSQSEIDAAFRIIELATDGGIVLPLSLAHLTETQPLFGDRRYGLGLAMARLSGGWELRSPFSVWENELAVMLAKIEELPLPTNSQLPVVTTEPQAFLNGGVRAYEIDNDWELFQLAVSEPNVTLSLLIDTNPTPKSDLSAWVCRQQEITDYFARKSLSHTSRRRQASGFFWTDNVQMLAQAASRVGVDPRVAAGNIDALLQQTENQPFLSKYSKLLRLRHLDRQSKWHQNDLNDMLYLSCASGYCDYVVAERHTGTQLRQIAQSRGETPNTYLTLADLAAALDRDGVKTAAERGTGH